jgi:hypothetical protein
VYGFVRNGTLSRTDVLGLAPSLIGIGPGGSPIYSPNPPGDWSNPYPTPRPQPEIPVCPWELLINWMRGGPDLMLNETAIGIAKNHHWIETARDNVKRNVRSELDDSSCGDRRSLRPDDYFLPFVSLYHHHTGSWQVSVSWDCMLDVASEKQLVNGRCCCPRSAYCYESGEVSKTYTFAFTEGGNPANANPGTRLWNRLITDYQGRDTTYNISGSWADGFFVNSRDCPLLFGLE